MKVWLKWPMRSFAGVSRDKTMVYRSCRCNQLFIGSRYTCPRITEHNHRQGSKLTQANVLYKAINAAFVEELKIYAEAYNKKHGKKKRLPPNFYNIFIKALCNGTVKIEDLDSLERFVGLYGNTIEAWIANGLLPKVKAVFLGVAVWVSEEFGALKTRLNEVFSYVLAMQNGFFDIPIINNNHRHLARDATLYSKANAPNIFCEVAT